MTTRARGNRLVLLLYVLLVAFAGVTGALFPMVVRDAAAPALFFVLPLPPTPVGFALYGAVTIAIVLGVPLLLVATVSARIDEDAV